MHLPRWCTNGEDLPEVYEVIARHLTTKGSDAIDTILEASNLSEDLLHHIKSIANKSVPGKWISLEVRIALGLVALAQVLIFIAYPLFTGTSSFLPLNTTFC